MSQKTKYEAEPVQFDGFKDYLPKGANTSDTVNGKASVWPVRAGGKFLNLHKSRIRKMFLPGWRGLWWRLVHRLVD